MFVFNPTRKIAEKLQLPFQRNKDVLYFFSIFLFQSIVSMTSDAIEHAYVSVYQSY
jgi:hypothetical protein